VTQSTKWLIPSAARPLILFPYLVLNYQLSRQRSTNPTSKERRYFFAQPYARRNLRAIPRNIVIKKKSLTMHNVWPSQKPKSSGGNAPSICLKRNAHGRLGKFRFGRSTINNRILSIFSDKLAELL
jgi:hypothetical protein